MTQTPGPEAAAMERQLYVLRTTYPAWEIDTEVDLQGAVWWRATLLRPVTPEMAQRGVQEFIRGSDGVELGVELSRQTTLLPACPPPLYQ